MGAYRGDALPVGRHRVANRRYREGVIEPATIPDAAREAILDWYGLHRRPLPFRETTDPYAVLVSEAMAQQTQAARAGEAWSRFMVAFPTPAALADAPFSAVLRAWRGLGYNRRARNLWRAARQIVELHAGAVPADVEALQRLPGVGPYTARAVAAIAFGIPVGAVDTNVRRVLGRIALGDGRLGAAAFQAMADAAVPTDRAGDWTHALMDVGASACGPRVPDCPSCPARPWCRYAASRVADGLARPVPKSGQGANRGRAAAAAATVPFARTSRWLRGRIVDRLRAAPDDAWIAVDGPFGLHEGAAVAAALDALAREGLIELEPTNRAGARRARLPTT